MKISKSAALGLIVGLAMCAVFATNSRAQDNASSGPFGGRIGERVKEKLNLTAEQVTQIKSVFKGEKDTLASLMNRLHDAHTGLRIAIHKSGATEASVRQAAAAVASAESDFAVERLKLWHKISPILTDEQRAGVDEIEARIDGFGEDFISRASAKLSE